MIDDLIWLVLTTLFYGFVIAYIAALVPAMVLMGLRQRWLYFAAGFLTLGLVWFIGSFAELGPSRRAILAGVGVVLLVGLISARPALLIGVDGSPLQNSVDRLLADNDQCQQAGDEWICAAYDGSISGDREYKVDVDWMGCWSGKPIPIKRLDNGPIESPEISGCITLIDLP